MPYRKTADRQKHNEEVRASFLNAARKLMDRGGLKAVTVRNVVRMAQSSTGNYYFYFQDKKTLLKAVLEQELTEVIDRIDQTVLEARSYSDSKIDILGTIVYSGILFGLEGRTARQALFSSEMRELIRPLLEQRLILRTQKFFASMPTLPNDIDEDLLPIFWQSSILFLLEQSAAGRIESKNTDQSAKSCVRWNLRALGCRPDEVEKALQCALKVWNTGPWRREFELEK